MPERFFLQKNMSDELASMRAYRERVFDDHAPARCLSFDEMDPWHKEEPCHVRLTTAEGSGMLLSEAGGPMSKYGNENQDAAGAYEGDGFTALTVMDGAGGSGDGLAASRYSLALFHHLLDQDARSIQDDVWSAQTILTQERLDRYIRFIDQQLKLHSADMESARPLYGAMAGVLLVKGEQGETKILTHIHGDCRVICLHNGAVDRVRSTWPQNQAGLLSFGLGIPTDYWTALRKVQHVLLNGVGLTKNHWKEALPGAPPSIQQHTARRGDIYLVMSDGVADLVTDYEVEQFAKTLDAHEETRIELFTDAIYRLTYERNNSPTDVPVELLLKEGKRGSIIPNPTRNNYPTACGDNLSLIGFRVD